jgi:hypothetical protein
MNASFMLLHALMSLCVRPILTIRTVGTMKAGDKSWQLDFSTFMLKLIVS